MAMSVVCIRVNLRYPDPAASYSQSLAAAGKRFVQDVIPLFAAVPSIVYIAHMTTDQMLSKPSPRSLAMDTTMVWWRLHDTGGYRDAELLTDASAELARRHFHSASLQQTSQFNN